MIAVLTAAAFAMHVQVELGPPRTPPPPRQSVEQVLARMGIGADSLKRLAAMARDVAPPPRSAVTRAPEESGPRTAPPPRGTLQELLDIVRQQPRGRALLDSLKAAGVKIPEVAYHSGAEGPPAVVRGPKEGTDMDLIVQQTWTITPMQPKVPGLALSRVSPVFQDSSSAESWAMRPSSLCNPGIHAGDSQYSPLPTSSTIPGLFSEGYFWYAKETTGKTAALVNRPYWTMCSNYAPQVAVTQPEIFVSLYAPSAGNYLITLRGWGKPTLVGGALNLTSAETIPVTGAYANVWLSESRNHGWNDYPFVVYFSSGGRKGFGYKVLGPVGVTFWASEVSVMKIP